VTPHHTTRHTGATILADKTKDREALKPARWWPQVSARHQMVKRPLVDNSIARCQRAVEL